MNIDVKMADRILDTKLPTAVKLVYMVIVNHANAKSREAFPSWDTIARKASIGHGTVSKALKLLVKRGFVTKYSSPGRRSKTYKPTDPTSPPDELNSPPDELLKSNRCTLKVHQMDTNIRIEQKKITTTSTSMNEEDEDVFISLFDGFWKADPGKCDGSFQVSAAAKMAAFSVGGGSPKRLAPPWSFPVVHHGGFIPQYLWLVHSSVSASYTPV